MENFGVSPENIGFAHVSMSSENFICVRENKTSDKSSLKLVDLRKGTEISEKPMIAESAIMNPTKSHLALKGKGKIQNTWKLQSHILLSSPKHNSSF